MRARLSGIPPPPREHAGVPPPPPKAGAAPLSQLNAGAHPAGVRGRPAPPGASEIATPEIAADVPALPCLAPGQWCPTPASR
jgi:hypothetical protein